MKLFLKRLTVYSLCFFICFLPTRQAYAWWGAAAVIIDVITTPWVDGDDVKVGGICGGRKFASNDPIWKCEGKTSKSNFLKRAAKSKRMGALLLAAGVIIDISTGQSYQATTYRCFMNGSYVFYPDFAPCDSYIRNHLQADYNPSSIQTYPENDHIKYSVTVQEPDGPITYLNVAGVRVYKGEAISDEDAFNDFWQTSPRITPDEFLPDPTPEVPSPVHPEPEWFPETFPVSPPYTPKPGVTPDYPKELPDSHPDKRPEGEEAPIPNPDWFPSTEPGKNPDSWPQEVPSPGQKPVPWPLPDREPSINPNPNPDPDPNPNPNPDPDPNPNPNPDPDPNPLPIPLPVIGPITREQFRTEQQRFYDEAASALPQPTTFFSDHADTVQKAMSDFLENKITPDVPEFEFNIFGYFTFGGGSCSGFTVPASMGRISGEITLDKHCQPWDSTFRPTLEWSLYLMTGLYIYVLFSRTVRSV